VLCIPGSDSHSIEEIESGFDTLVANEHSTLENGEYVVSRRKLVDAMLSLTPSTEEVCMYVCMLLFTL
jgi:hypothetical protein